MSLTSEQQQCVNSLADTCMLLQKTQVNLKKCPKQRLTKGYIDAKITTIEDYWKTYVTTHQKLVICTPNVKRSDIPHFTNDEYFMVEELYATLKGDLKDMLYMLSERRSSSPGTSQIDKSLSGQMQNSTVHLPRIQLPKFTGSYEEWPAFKDMFCSLVHENTSLSDVQKLHYLKISVAGVAESLLKNIQVTSSNYTSAWEILKTRYGNKRLILNSIMKKLFNQKKMTFQSAVQLKGLLDTTTECLNSLTNLDISTASWDIIIIHLLIQKIDPETHKNWEEYAYREEKEALPTWDEFKRFMESKFRTLELVNANTATSNREVKVKERSLHITTPNTEKIIKTCVMCKENHTLCHCKDFIKMEPKQRSDFVKNNHLCFNCLVPGHSVSRCRIPVSCRICHRRHHSLLHETKETEPAATPSNSHMQPLVSQHVAEEEEVQVNTMITSHLTTGHGIALLATAIVEATNEHGQPILLRALIDQGSEASFISEKAAQFLQLKKQPMKGTIIGVGTTKTEIKHVVQLKIHSRYDKNFSLQIQVYVMPKQLTTRIPTRTINSQSWPHIQGLDLADPNYCTPGSIDLLLGVKEYAQIVKQELIKGPAGTPCAQKTKLGWILFGNIQQKVQEHTYLTVMHHQIDVDEILKSIWEVEADCKRTYTKEEKLCEDIYKRSTTRNSEGRYIVTLPFRTDNPQSPCGNTKEHAKQRFMHLERRFNKSPNLKEEYKKVIYDYIEQEHIENIPENERDIEKAIYLPHHAVVREDKETSRTRVVFDASCKGSNNISLNQKLLVGPQLQDDLRNLLMRWRTKQICFMADIKQMYRQILVTKSDTDFQRIFWRDNEHDGLQEYRLLRVTFGTAPAPYLAVRTLHQVADDEGEGKPQAVQAIKTNFYMDDYLDGADTIEEAKSLAEDVTMILQKGGFELAKWSSNNIEFMKSIPEDKRSINAQEVDINLDSTIKALGVVWKLKKDTFEYNFNLSSAYSNITKRQILSDLQRLFDPLGWIAPSTVLAKILIQKLWLEKVNWDEGINDTLQKEWKQIRSDLNNVKKIQINRWLGTSKTKMDSIQLHGFSDASMRAYAAVVYIRIETVNHEIQTKIIASRTRVAPIKIISLPRLELTGALLLSKLMKQVGEAMNIPTSRMYAWTDSSIVVAWLSGEPNRWKTFVANRVVEIVENLNNKHWHHVDSKENPADLASRGMLLEELINCDLWWSGPRWLSEREINISKKVITTDLERKTTKINTYFNTEDEEPERCINSKFDNFNNITELLKTIIYCKRFLSYKNNPNTDSDITTQELEESLTICIKMVQRENYTDEIERLTTNKQVKKKSLLRFLNPYLDEKQLLRVGGRLRHSKLPDERKHPIILSNKNKLTPLIVADAHAKTLHGGVQLMLCYLQSKYWIFKAKSICKKYIHRCFICAKLNATTRSQIMGNLPEVRVTPARPFLRSGVDFAGPYQVLMSKGRGNKTLKAYIAIFICMSTKAIHIELVGDLSSEAFIGAFRRFVARRGKCSDIWSDQGRNFVGANKELHEAWVEAKLQFNGEIAETLATDGTQWHFIPAYSPSYGGLWEAGVKSIKHHLKRILTSHLTFEEMTTILCQVEACLNSRPLCPIDDNDPDHTNALTPGHFLIGDTPIVVPTSDLTNTRISALSRWQHTQKLLNDFWKRWQSEYLTRLQQRPKWLKKEEEFKIGDIVLIKTENLPPGKWSLGRIVDKHPGSDGFTRVYSVKSGSAVTKRTVSKLCALPIDYS